MHLQNRAARRAALATLPWIAAGGAALAVLFFFNPLKYNFYPPCLFRKLTGLYCPGCGSGRALHQLLHGRVLLALDLNPLMVLSTPFLLYAFLARSGLMGKKLAARPARSPVWIYSLLALIVSYWILRNIPAFPFTLLAP